jgi:hypothetical protein
MVNYFRNKVPNTSPFCKQSSEKLVDYIQCHTDDYDYGHHGVDEWDIDADYVGYRTVHTVYKQWAEEVSYSVNSTPVDEVSESETDEYRAEVQ